MTFPEPNVLQGTIADLKDIISRSQNENQESVRLLGQIEALVVDIEKKTKVVSSSTIVVNNVPVTV